jgi:hypothetical protein
MNRALLATVALLAAEGIYRPVGGGGGGSGITQLTGDVTAGPGSGAVPATVARINGATVPAAGALTTGNVLQVTGTSALGYAAVNLAGGAGYITGNLPVTNIAPAGTNGFVLTTTGGVTGWAAATGGSGITALTGDVTASGTGSVAATVVRLTGTGGVVTVPTATLNFGTNPSTTGAINLANGTGIYQRNAANTADIRFLDMDTVNEILIGDYGAANVTLVSNSGLVVDTASGGVFSYEGTTLSTSAGNAAFNGTGSFGGGSGVIGLLTAATQPTTLPAGLVLAEGATGLFAYQPGNSFNRRSFCPVPQGTAASQAATVVDFFGFASTTTGATTTTIVTIPLPGSSNSIGMIVTAVGRQTSGTVGATTVISQTVGFKNIAGTVTALTTQGTATVAFDTGFTGGSIGYAISGTNVEIQVNQGGTAAGNADWTCYVTACVYN